MLYAGTEYGLFVSFDDGASWQPFQRNLPVVPITDLAVKDGDLVVATQGRSFWILDDLTPLRDYRDALRGEALRVFAPRPTARWGGGGPGDEEESSSAAVGKNPPSGVLVYYWLKDKPSEKDVLTVDVLQGDTVLRTYTSEKKKEGKEGEPEKDEDPRADKPLEPKAGLNRLVWDMRILRPTLLPKAVIWGDDDGPLVAPGTYSVRLKVGNQTQSANFEVVPRPGIAATRADLDAQYRLLKDASDGLKATHDAVAQIRDVKSQVTTVLEHAKRLGKDGGLEEKGKALTEKLTAIEKKLVNPDIKSNQDVLNYPPALDHSFAGLASVVSSADAKPTDSSVAYYKEIRAKLDAVQAELAGVLGVDLDAFNRAVEQAGIPPVVAARPKEASK
jgi:hypothetical protein